MAPSKETDSWVRFDVQAQREAAIEAAVQAIQAGQCIVLPTDTVYGIGANAFSSAAVARLLDAKKRGRDLPPPVLIAEPGMFAALADDLPWFASQLGEACWPGALTMIVKAQPSLDLDLGETNGTIAVRVPDHDFTRELLRHTGPLAVSSANLSGEDAATTIDHAIAMLGSAVSVYLDDGEAGLGVASTIIDFSSTSTGRIVRSGALSFDELKVWAPHLKDAEASEVAVETEQSSAEDETLGDVSVSAADPTGGEDKQSDVDEIKPSLASESTQGN